MEMSMKLKRKVLIAGRSKDALLEVENCLSSSKRLDLTIRQIVNGHADPLYGIDEMPDLLVLHISGLEGGELEALLERPASTRPPMVVVSRSDDSGVMRMAMKAGARDFVPKLAGTELLDSINSIFAEISEQQEDRQLISVINAKGGSGATFVACNLAHLTISTTEESTALVSLDLQFPTLPSYFDMRPKHGIVQALQSVGELDAVALDAIMASHESGLKVLAAQPEDFRFNDEMLVNGTEDLLNLFQRHYRHVFVDVPRRLDSVSAQVLSRSSKIVLVAQQSLPHVHDAARMQHLLLEQLGIHPSQIVVVVNRFNKNSDIQLEDFEKALSDSEIVSIPNNFRDVSESINVGVPIYEYARQSAVTKALIALQSKVAGIAPGDHPALRNKGISSILQKTRLQQLFGGA
jgi:pilus assembly protein CpaE